jgi:hypothetical protein
MNIDWTDPTKLQTRDGRKVLWCADSGLDVEYSCVAVIDDGSEVFRSYMRDGSYTSTRASTGDVGFDIIAKPVIHERWVNVYRDYSYRTKEEAAKYCGPDRIACLKITFTEGEGL